MASDGMPMRRFGRHEEQVSALGLGGYQNLCVARAFLAMTPREMEAHRRRLAGPVADGRFELYKTTAEHDGDEGRRQPGFPTSEAVAQ